MSYTSDQISRALTVIADTPRGYEAILRNKIEAWQAAAPMLQFDEFGRAKVATLSTEGKIEELALDILCDKYTSYGAYFQYLYEELSKNERFCKDYEAQFAEVFPEVGEYMFFNYKLRGILTVQGRKVYLTVNNKQYKLLPILESAHRAWTKEASYGQQYKESMDAAKELRAKGCTLDTSADLRYYEDRKQELGQCSAFVTLDRKLNELPNGEDVYISVNPLDHFIVAGSGRGLSQKDFTPSEVMDYHPTKFRTCWGTAFTWSHQSTSYIVESVGEYAYLQGMLSFGAITEKAVMFIRNNSAPIPFEVDGLSIPLHGVAVRSHAYLQGGKIFFDNMYPVKRTGLRIALKAALGSAYMTKQDFADMSDATGCDDLQAVYAIKWDCSNEDAFIEDCREREAPFLDSVAVDTDEGSMYLFAREKMGKSARISIGYEDGYDMSPLYNAGMFGGGERNHCEHCGDSIREGCGYYNDINERHYCSTECLYDAGFYYCERCGELHREDLVINGEYYCSDHCAQLNNYYECTQCGAWEHMNNGYHSEEGFYCTEDCMNDAGFYTCDECGDTFYREDDETMCSHCTSVEERGLDSDDDDEEIYCEHCGAGLTDTEIAANMCSDCGVVINESAVLLFDEVAQPGVVQPELTPASTGAYDSAGRWCPHCSTMLMNIEVQRNECIGCRRPVN